MIEEFRRFSGYLQVHAGNIRNRSLNSHYKSYSYSIWRHIDRDLTGMVMRVLQGTPKSRIAIAPLSAVVQQHLNQKCWTRKPFPKVYTWGDPKILGIVKKKLFKVFVQVWNISPLRSTPPATGCSNPSTAPSDLLAALYSISVEDFRQCFQQWERCWDCCIQSQGEYFEGD